MYLLTGYRSDIVLTLGLFGVLSAHFFHLTDQYIVIGAAIVGLLPVVWGVIQAFRERGWVSMDMLASVALTFSIIGGEWVSAIFVELMLAAARILDEMTRDRTEKSIRGLLRLRPETARVRTGNTLVTTPVESIRVGDVVVIGLGERIPVDGVMMEGSAAVDESSLTGESLPVHKEAGSRVLSSTLVQVGSVMMRTTHVGKDTTLERVIGLVQSARTQKPKTQTLGERFGAIYITVMFIGSALLLFVTHDVALVLAVVLVVCADDIAVAIPIAYLRAIYAAAHQGVIIKGGRYLEMLGQVRTVVFDKTGTLTTGVLTVDDIVPIEKHTVDEVLRYAAIAATRSTHPVSRAVVLHAQKQGRTDVFPVRIEERGGKGIIAYHAGETIVFGRKTLLDELKMQVPDAIIAHARTASDAGYSVSYVAVRERVIGYIAAADQVRANAAETIRQLRAMGIERVVMLTGDNPRVAAHIAAKLDVDVWHAELLPEDKVRIIAELQAREPIAMVGDGVNDAAALSRAGIGIAMGGLGSEGTIESAQIILMRDDLSTLPRIISLARKVRRISLQDFGIWGVTNSVGLALVFSGTIGPAGAAAYNFLTDFIPLTNSARATMTQPSKK